MGISNTELEHSLRSIATVFNDDGNTTNGPATQEVFDALRLDDAIVKEIQYNPGVLNAIAGEVGGDTVLGQKAVALLQRVDEHKAELGYLQLD